MNDIAMGSSMFIQALLLATLAFTSAPFFAQEAQIQPVPEEALRLDHPEALPPEKSWTLKDLRGSELELNSLEVAALFGAEKTFRHLATPKVLRELNSRERARLMACLVQPEPPQEAYLEQAEERTGGIEALKSYRSELATKRQIKLGLLRSLLETGFSPKLRDDTGLTPLHHAAYWAESEAVELLLAKGAEIDAVSGQVPVPGVREPLHGPATADYLISQSQANAVSAMNAKTALQLALRSRLDLHMDLLMALNPVSHEAQIATLRILLSHKPKVAGTDMNGMTPLMYAAHYLHQPDILEIPRDRGSKASFGDSKEAAEIFKAILDLGADPGAVALRGYTAMAFAVRSNLFEVVKLLKDRTPRVAQLQDPSGNVVFDPVHQALSFALLQSQKDIAKLLLELPVDPLRELPSGIFPEPGSDFPGEGRVTMLDAAILGGPEMVELLAPKLKDANRLESARKASINGLLERKDWGEVLRVAKLRKDPELRRVGLALALDKTLDAYDARFFSHLLEDGALPQPDLVFLWNRLFFMIGGGGDGPKGTAAGLDLLRRFKDWKGRRDLPEVLKALILLEGPPADEALALLKASKFPFRSVEGGAEILKEYGPRNSKGVVKQVRTLLQQPR
jgi:ankyrin repeat protein